MDVKTSAEIATDLLQQIAVFAVIASVMVYGVKETIKSIMNKKPEDNLHRAVGLSLTYGFSMILGFIMQNEYLTVWYYRIVFGIAIGTLAVALYQSVVKSILKLIPSMMEKFFGGVK